MPARAMAQATRQRVCGHTKDSMMPLNVKSHVSSALEKHEAGILEAWLKAQDAAQERRRDLVGDGELREQSGAFLRSFRKACQTDASLEIKEAHWAPVKDLLADLARNRASQGFSPSETAMFVFSLKQPLFGCLREDLLKNPDLLADTTWAVNLVLDRLGLYTTELHQKSREEVIARQQEEMLELSTPVVQLWEGILALPVIGTLDSRRTQSVMESLLQRIVDTESEVAIIDITGVPTVDTLTAQHLLKTITAARLMGAECIVSGVRPQIAQTIVHLGVDLGDVVTKSTMAAALALALQRRNLIIKERAATNPRA